MDDKTLTVEDLIILSTLLTSVTGNGTVRWVESQEDDEVKRGTTRRLRAHDGRMIPTGADVRDQSVEILVGFSTHYLTVRHVMDLHHRGLLVFA